MECHREFQMSSGERCSNVSSSSSSAYAYKIYVAEGAIITIFNFALFLILMCNRSIRSQKEFLIYAGESRLTFVQRCLEGCMLFDVIFGITYFSSGAYRLYVVYTTTFIPLTSSWGCLLTVHNILFVYITSGAGILVLVTAVDRFIGVFFPTKYLLFRTKYVVLLLFFAYALPLVGLPIALVTSYPTRNTFNQDALCTMVQSIPLDLFYGLRLTRVVCSLACVLIYVPIFLHLRKSIWATAGVSFSSNGPEKRMIRMTVTVVLITLNTLLLYVVPDIIMLINPETETFAFYIMNLNKGLVNIFIFLITQKTLRTACLNAVRPKAKRMRVVSSSHQQNNQTKSTSANAKRAVQRAWIVMALDLVDEEKDEEKLPLDPQRLLNKPPVKNFDEFVHFGKYVCLILVVAEFLCLSTLANMVYMVFSGANPKVVGCGDVAFNSTDEAEVCKQFTAVRNETGCTPVVEHQFYSVNVEFDYLCSDSKFVKSSISYQMTAVLVGAFFFGQMSDMYGRRFVLLLAMFMGAVFSALTAYTDNFLMFTISRILSGFFTGGTSAVQGVFLVENIPRKHRMLINTVITWSPNFIIYPIIAYYCKEWRSLSVAGAVINVIGCMFLYYCFESPRFIIQKGRIDEAREIIGKIREINNESCERTGQEIEAMLIHEQELFERRAQRAKKHTLYDIVNNMKMFKWTFTLCFGIMVTSLVNYGILFNMEKLSGSLYFNNIFFGIVRWIMNIAVGVGDYYIVAMGRKALNVFSESFNIICLSVIFASYYFGNAAQLGTIVRFCSIAVTSMCAQVYLAKFMTTTELYPTAVRNLAASALSMSSRVGTIFGPILFYLSDLHPSYPYLALTILITIDIFGFQSNIPETKGKLLENHLPTTVAEAKERRRSLVDRRPSNLE